VVSIVGCLMLAYKGLSPMVEEEEEIGARIG